MISEGSCDTEDWRNDAENSAQVTCIHYRIYSNCLLLNRKINTYIFYIMFYYIYIKVCVYIIYVGALCIIFFIYINTHTFLYIFK